MLVGAQTGCSSERVSTEHHCSLLSPQTLVGFITPKRTTFGLSDGGQREYNAHMLLGDSASRAVIFRL